MNKTIMPICWFCQHIVDLDSDNFERIDTMDTLTSNSPKAYVHELCAAEAEAEYKEDKRIEAWIEWSEDQAEIWEEE